MTTTFVTGLRLIKQARCASRALACPSDSKSAGCATAEALTSLGAAGKKHEPADMILQMLMHVGIIWQHITIDLNMNRMTFHRHDAS